MIKGHCKGLVSLPVYKGSLIRLTLSVYKGSLIGLSLLV